LETNDFFCPEAAAEVCEDIVLMSLTVILEERSALVFAYESTPSGDVRDAVLLLVARVATLGPSV
jgi:hypothetical protein